VVVGVLRVALAIEGAYSLKDKRRALRKVIDRLRSRFNLAVAEVGDNELWNRAELGLAAVSNSAPHANSMLDQALDAIRAVAEVDVLNSDLELIHMGDGA